MTNLEASPELAAKDQRRGAIRRRARNALRLAVHIGVLVFVASCVMPSPQGQYQGQGQYGNGHGSQTNAGAEMNVVYQPPKKPEREAIRAFLQENKTFDRYAAALSHMFQFPQPVNVVWTECGVVNAAWAADQHHVISCDSGGGIRIWDVSGDAVSQKSRTQ